MSTLNFWKLCDHLTVTQASLLICGLDPSAWESEIGELQPETFPAGYYATRSALFSALEENNELGEVRYDQDCTPLQRDPRESYVKVVPLKEWLWAKGVREGFFFPPREVPRDYLNQTHARYTPQLAAAVRAWEAMEDPELLVGKTPKQALDKWLRENAALFSLTNETDGTHNNKAIERIAQVANWAPQGGAPSTPGGDPNKTVVSGNLDEEVLNLPAPTKALPSPSTKPDENGFALDDEIPF